MKTMNKWLLAGLIGLSVAGAQATPMVIDDFTDTPQSTQYATWLRFDEGSTLNDVTHVTVTVPNQSERSIIEFNAYDATSKTELSSGHLVTTHTSNLLLGDNSNAVQYFFDTPISLALTETIWIRGSGSWATFGEAPGIGVSISDADGTGNWPTHYAAFQYDQGASGSQVDWSFSVADLKNSGWGDDPLTGITTFMVYQYNRDWSITPPSYSTWTFDMTKIEILGDAPPVPEPETVWMIVAVLASLAVTFRRQLIGMVVKA